MPEVGRDLEFSDDGDLLIDETGDLKLADAPRSVVQDIQFRAQNNYGDFEPNPLLAADLQRYRGHPNNRQTGEAIKEAVYYSLIRDGRFQRGDVFVDVVPYSQRAVAIFVFVMAYVEDIKGRVNRNAYDEFNLIVQFTFDLDIGLITRITGVKE
jgi:hypothetical protein